MKKNKEQQDIKPTKLGIAWKGIILIAAMTGLDTFFVFFSDNCAYRCSTWPFECVVAQWGSFVFFVLSITMIITILLDVMLIIEARKKVRP